MKNLLTSIFGGAAIGILIVALFLIAPFLLLWTINGLLEAGGSEFNLQYGLWELFLAFLLIVLLRGGSSSSS